MTTIAKQARAEQARPPLREIFPSDVFCYLDGAVQMLRNDLMAKAAETARAKFKETRSHAAFYTVTRADAMSAISELAKSPVVIKRLSSGRIFEEGSAAPEGGRSKLRLPREIFPSDVFCYLDGTMQEFRNDLMAKAAEIARTRTRESVSPAVYTVTREDAANAISELADDPAKLERILTVRPTV